MILGFNERFKRPIQHRIKIHTIRADKNNRWCVGRTIQMATGVRTKKYQCFETDICRGVQAIEIIYSSVPLLGITRVVKVDERELTIDEIATLAKNDGFNDASDFFDWFNKDFSGKIIHWTNFKY